jgi:hypothetical protein
VSFDFAGPVQNIYTTLVIRLTNSGEFKKKELWKNAAIFTSAHTAKYPGTYGIFLHTNGEGHGELTLFFDKEASEKMRFLFELYVDKHLRKWTQAIIRRPIFTCPVCGVSFTDLQVKRRRERNYDWIMCVCDTQVSLLDREEPITAADQSRLSAMDRAADAQRDRGTAQTILKGKKETGHFDVFLCHNGDDKLEVKRIGERLKERGILPWLDEWELPPGLPWQRLLWQQIEQIKSAAVFVGKNGIGPWQQEELEAFLSEFVNRRCPVIPVLLPDAQRELQLPGFLKGRTWVDFRKWDPDPIEQLIWGITWKRISA